MVQPADAWKRDDLACNRQLDVARDRRVSAKRPMRPIAIVVKDVLANETEQMSFTQCDNVVEKLATQSPDPSFGESVLPGGARRDPNLLDGQVSTRASNSAP